MKRLLLLAAAALAAVVAAPLVPSRGGSAAPARVPPRPEPADVEPADVEPAIAFSPSVMRIPGLSLREGSEFDYRFDLVTRGASDGFQDQAARLTGRLHLRVGASERGAHTIQASVSGDVEGSLAFHLHEDGRLGPLTFAPPTPEATQQCLADVVHLLQVVLPPTPTWQWRVQVDDERGSHTEDYAVLDGWDAQPLRIRRSRAGSDETTEAILDPSMGWIRSIRCQRRALDDVGVARGWTTFSAERAGG